jgi:hypothetical protein
MGKLYKKVLPEKYLEKAVIARMMGFGFVLLCVAIQILFFVN